MLLTLVVLLAVVTASSILIPLHRRIQQAKATGIRYVVLPNYIYNFLASKLFRILILNNLNKFLSVPSATSWRNFGTASWPLKLSYAPFKAFGTDNFFTVAPGGIIFNTADANVVSQISAHGSAFPKAVEIYKSIAILGPNVVSSDGPSYKYQRKLIAPAFGEKNNRLVWQASLEAAQIMVQSFRSTSGKLRPAQNILKNVMRLSLEVLGKAGLGQKLVWKNEFTNENLDSYPSSLDGLKDNFAHIVEFFMVNIVVIMFAKALPLWIQPIVCHFLNLSPKLDAYDLLHQQLEGLIKEKRLALNSGTADKTRADLIGNLLKGQDDEKSRSQLSDSEVMGNLFAFIVAGHETSANSIHFALIRMAMHPTMQRKVQREMEDIFNGRPVSKWEYERDFPRLFNGMTGMVLKEVLRLTSPILSIPKVVSASAMPLTIDNKTIVLPPNTVIRLCVPALHRNPKFWPRGPPEGPENSRSTIDISDNDLEEFKPERWIRQLDKGNGPQAGTSTTSSSASHFTPVKGSYLPFSAGSRGCIGQRFAEVEIMAVLARIFTQYSVELAVDEWATNEEIECMPSAEKGEVWCKAHHQAQDKLRNRLTCIITVQLNGTSVPLQFVERGQEQFFDL